MLRQVNLDAGITFFAMSQSANSDVVISISMLQQAILHVAITLFSCCGLCRGFFLQQYVGDERHMLDLQ